MKKDLETIGFIISRQEEKFRFIKFFQYFVIPLLFLFAYFPSKIKSFLYPSKINY